MTNDLNVFSIANNRFVSRDSMTSKSGQNIKEVPSQNKSVM